MRYKPEVFLEQNNNLEDGMLEYAAHPESGGLLLCLHVHGVCPFSRSAREKSLWATQPGPVGWRLANPKQPLHAPAISPYIRPYYISL